MNIFDTNRVLARLDQMITNAMNGDPVETSFDETKMSALETKLSHYLATTKTSRSHLSEEKNKLNELISDISHQTKTPLANILLYSQLLAESDLSKQDRLCVEALSAQAEKLNFLITSLVKMSRLETGIISITPKFQPLAPLLEQVLSDTETLARAKRIKITCPITDLSACFDFKWTLEAVYNILDNAIKYSKSDSEILISFEAYSLFCRINIQDFGIGIREEELSKIFTRFYRSPDVSDAPGVGIGLHLARQVMSENGGYIKVISKSGSGSTFSLFLPMES